MGLLQNSYRIETAIDALKSLVDIDVQLHFNSNELNALNSTELSANGFLTINNHSFLIKFKRDFRLNQIPDLINEKKNNTPFILIADAISDNIKTVLREHKINYLDAAGNAFIQSNTGLNVFIHGQKMVFKTDSNKDKAFTKKGLSIVFHFLIDETLINTPYRNISAVSETSLDTVTKVIQSLRQQGFIIQVNDKKVRLTDKKRLFEKWADAYEMRLKPHLFIGNYRFKNIESERDWQNITLLPTSVWGGEPAASILTDYYLRPAIFTLYTTETKAELVKNYRFLPDPKGNIKVYLPFVKDKEQKTTAPIWVYADMLNSGIHRNIEVAEKIYEKYVKSIF